MPRSPVATGGCFSEGYIVESAKGVRAYLKALDYYEALSHSDPATVLQAMTAAYNFERELLQKCKTSRLDRIIIALDDGSISIDPGNPVGVVTIYYLRACGRCMFVGQMANFRSFDLALVLEITSIR